MPDAPTTKRNAFERLLGIFAKVEAGEGLGVALMFLNIFLLLTTYYVLKTVRQGLIVGGGGMLGLTGAQLQIYSSGGMALLLLGIVPAYGALASRVSRTRLLSFSLSAVSACLVGFYALGRAGVPLALPFFLWLGVVNVFLIAQFWSFANDIYTESQGKRLFAIIGVGGSVGAILGPMIAALGKHYILELMLIAAAMFGLCTLLYRAIDRLERDRAAGPTSAQGARSSREAPLSKEGGFQLVFRERYLLLIAVMLLIANLVNTTGEYILVAMVEQGADQAYPVGTFDHIDDPEQQKDALQDARKAFGADFYGGFYSTVNLIGFLIQAFVVSRVFKFVGVRVALFVLPVIALGAYSAIGLIGGLVVLRIAKTAENSTDYSLQNTVRQALFLPTTREAKYKAKAAIDTFFVRIGDALAATVVALGLHVFSLSPRAFSFANLALIALWLVVAAGIASKHRQLSPDSDPR